MAQNSQERLLVQRSPSSTFEKELSWSRKRKDFNYKPGALRTGSLALLVLCGLTLIGLLEYAVSKLPRGDDALTSMVFFRRNSSSSEERVDQSMSTMTTARTPRLYFPRYRRDETAPSATTISIFATRASIAFLPPDGTQSISSDSPPTLTMAPTAYASPDGTQSPQPIGGTVTSASLKGTGHAIVITWTESGFPTTSTLPISLLMPTSAYVVSSGSQTTVMPEATPPAAYIEPNGSQICASSNTDTAVVACQPGVHGKNDSVISYHWSIGKAFLTTYLPVLLAVIYRLSMSTVLADLSLIDPFRQLASHKGATPERAFFSFYHTPIDLRSPFKALTKSRWALACVAAAYTASSLLPALASEAIWVTTNYDCAHPYYPGTNNPCAPRATVSPPVIRILQGLLALCTIIVLSLLVLLSFGRTGLPANPSSIATIASLMQHSGLNEDLDQISTDHRVDATTLRSALKSYRYFLGFWKGDDSGTSYGIRPVHSIQTDDQSALRGSHDYEPICSGPLPSPAVAQAKIRWKDCALLFVVLGTFGVVLAYYLVKGDNGFNNFFNSNTFGPRFILTLAATFIAGMWKSVEQSSLVMAPFTRLAQRPSSASSTLCFAPSNIPLLSTWQALNNRYWLLSALTLTTLLAEILSIVISGVPYAPGLLWTQFLVCAYISLGILGFMVIIAVVVIFHRRNEPNIPAPPDTLGMKMWYLAGSRMLEDLEGVEWESSEVRDGRIKGLGKKYVFEEKVGRDGRRRWVVDEVEDEQT